MGGLLTLLMTVFFLSELVTAALGPQDDTGNGCVVFASISFQTLFK